MGALSALQPLIYGSAPFLFVNGGVIDKTGQDKTHYLSHYHGIMRSAPKNGCRLYRLEDASQRACPIKRRVQGYAPPAQGWLVKELVVA